MIFFWIDFTIEGYLLTFSVTSLMEALKRKYKSKQENLE